MDFLEDPEAEEANLIPCSPEFTVENAKSSEKKISHKATFGDTAVPTFCVRFDHNDKYLAAAKGNGSIQIFNLFTGKASYHLNQDMEEPKPCMTIR